MKSKLLQAAGWIIGFGSVAWPILVAMLWQKPFQDTLSDGVPIMFVMIVIGLGLIAAGERVKKPETKRGKVSSP